MCDVVVQYYIWNGLKLAADMIDSEHFKILNPCVRVKIAFSKIKRYLVCFISDSSSFILFNPAMVRNLKSW
jgi:hypothetical protein